jgi:hypothetical protein
VHLELWEIVTGKRLASVEVDKSFQKVAFGVDGTYVILESKDLAMIHRISPNQSTSNNDENGHLSLSMEFIPVHDTQQSVSPRHYHYLPGNEWI